MLGHEVDQAGLVDRDLPVVEGGHLRRVDVAQGDLVAHRRQADAGHQADVAGPDDADAVPRRSGAVVARVPGHGVDPAVSTEIGVSVVPLASLARFSGRIDLAISSIVLALRSFFSVFDTQYQTPSF